ncbi:hypothetical protein JR316_0004279 [Psilocybe cubensis]|uniref:Uncharacterized protein n=2 Tax=Psilocybe cubensis TaxID=181762 RepID=A0ACB8H2W2_PSICU|nr:hypothetical protein JR316_0004279 [Psilocybe cubensis]KAH9482184.1 hypothetical protein JR316_0004279 [Psilocybe cubensis]
MALPDLKRKRTQSLSKSERTLEVCLKDGSALVITANKRPRLLRIEIPSNLNSGLVSSETNNGEDHDDMHSLFSSSDSGSLFNDLLDEERYSSPRISIDLDEDKLMAHRNGPPIQGLYFDPSVILPVELADEVVSFCMKTYFTSPADNQVMLFGRFLPPKETLASSSSGLPPILLELLDQISSLLRPVVPPDTYDVLFPACPTRARQAIINLYQPGEGITPHVDLLGRYGDGIIGVSFSSGSVMRFDKVDPQQNDSCTRWDLYLPERSLIVLSEDARYCWTHGIDKKRRDFVATASASESLEPAGTWIDRRTRMSVTFRWLLPDADVVGDG